MTSTAKRVSASPTASRIAIGLDVGGTKVAGGVVSATGEIIARLAPVSTPVNDQDAVIAALVDLVTDLRREWPAVSAVGVGAAGLIDWPEGTIRWAPNNVYRKLPLRRLIEAATGLPTVVDNDANVAAWAEKRTGNGSNHMIFLTVGTGIGGGLIVDGRLYRGRTGIAAEVGHMILDPHGGSRCGCGNIGCFEAVASGTALGQLGRQAAADSQGVLARFVDDPQQVTGRTVHEAAVRGDRTAIDLFHEIGTWLGIGAASLVNVMDFDTVVVGGGLVGTGELLLTPMRTAFEDFLFAPQHRDAPRIVAARLRDEAGWVGAGLLALDEARPVPTAAAAIVAPTAEPV
jgi:glucokinase